MGKIITEKPIEASEEEIRRIQGRRRAKLRVFVKNLVMKKPALIISILIIEVLVLSLVKILYFKSGSYFRNFIG